MKLTPRAVRILELVAEEAKNTRQDQVDPIHILTAIVRLQQGYLGYTEGNAAGLLNIYGLNKESLSPFIKHDN